MKGKCGRSAAFYPIWDCRVLSMKEAGVSLEIEENGTTFGENAEIKARAVWEQTGGSCWPTIPVWWWTNLGGEPGIYSARYLGEDTSTR